VFELGASCISDLNYCVSQDGRLQAGDQLLEVDGHSLVALTQERAAEYMTKTGQTVTLRVAKQGAIYHGLATLLSQPSPVLARAAANQRQVPPPNKNQPRPWSENVEPHFQDPEYPRNMQPRPINMQHSAQSSPALAGITLIL
jgi:afadin